MREQAQLPPMRPELVPQDWYEWWCSLWSPYEWILTPQRLGATVLVAANASNAPGTLTVNEPMYIFQVESRAERTDTGAFPSFFYSIGFFTSVEIWTGTSGAITQPAPLVTGDINAQTNIPRAWKWPREVNATDVINFLVDNPNNAQQLRVGVNVFGYVIRQRNQVLTPQHSPTMQR